MCWGYTYEQGERRGEERREEERRGEERRGEEGRGGEERRGEVGKWTDVPLQVPPTTYKG
jgi:hypothetical protein